MSLTTDLWFYSVEDGRLSTTRSTDRLICGSHRLHRNDVNQLLSVPMLIRRSLLLEYEGQEQFSAVKYPSWPSR